MDKEIDRVKELRERLNSILRVQVGASLVGTDYGGKYPVDLYIVRPYDRGKMVSAILSLKIDGTTLKELIEDNTKSAEIVRGEEAETVIRCIKDAKRVHPDWSIDDVIDLLLFREETRQVMKRGK